MAKTKKSEQTEITKERLIIIPPPNMRVAEFFIRGNTIMVQNKFSQKAKQQMIDDQKAGHSKKKGKARKPKDFMAMYENSKHIAVDGWYGIPASAFRVAMISACRLVGFTMTLAKLSVFIIPDGFDRIDSTPLVRITKGEPKYRDDPVRLSLTTTDVHARAMFAPGWEAKVSIEWDDDQFKMVDVTNLLMRVGRQVGIQEGRPDSKKSAGMGWGMFDVLDKERN